MAYGSPGPMLDPVTGQVADALRLLDRPAFQRVVLARRDSGLPGVDPQRTIDGQTIAFVAAQLCLPAHIEAALRELSQREVTVLNALWRSGTNIAATAITQAFARLLDEQQLHACLARLQDLALLMAVDREKHTFTVPACVGAVLLLRRSGQPRPAAMIFNGLRSEEVQRIYTHMQSERKATKKQDRVDAIVEELSHADRVRQRLAALPDFARRIFDSAAARGGSVEPYSLIQSFPEFAKQNRTFGFFLNDMYTRGDPNDGLLLLENQGLLVRYPPDWASKLVICDEVMTALLPPLKLTAADFVEPELQAPPAGLRPAGGTAAPALDAVECLQFVDEFQPSLTQKGLFAKPDARRLSRRLSITEAPYADFIFTLCLHAGLLRLQYTQISVVKKKSTQWLKAPALEQSSVMLESWRELQDWRDDRDEGYNRSGYTAPVQVHRGATLRLLAELPEAGVTLDSLAARLRYRIPKLFTAPSPPGEPPDGLPAPDAWINGVVRSLSWLGLVEPLTASGKAGVVGLRLTPTGRTLVTGTMNATDAIPRVDRLIVQPTLDVLAPPNIEPAVYRTLRGFTDAVSATGMRTVSLTMTSLRRAVDAGQPPDAVRKFLQQHSDAALPNTVDMLLADVQSKYGRIHIGQAGYYLTVDDPHLLAELGADKRLDGMIERVVAPTVALVSAANLETVLNRLRTAGHMPVLDKNTDIARPPARTAAPPRGQGSLDILPGIRKLLLQSPELMAEFAFLESQLTEEPDDGSEAELLLQITDGMFGDGGPPARLPGTPLMPFNAPQGGAFIADAGSKAGLHVWPTAALKPGAKGGAAKRTNQSIAAPPEPLAASERVTSRGDIQQLLDAAIDNGAQVEIEYRAKIQGREHVQTHTIDPYEVVGNHVFAFSHEREVERQFKLNRIAWARLNGELADPLF